MLPLADERHRRVTLDFDSGSLLDAINAADEAQAVGHTCGPPGDEVGADTKRRRT